jgi:hypothetical protein
MFGIVAVVTILLASKAGQSGDEDRGFSKRWIRAKVLIEIDTMYQTTTTPRPPQCYMLPSLDL